MKNNKGITLTSLIIYIAVMFVVLAVIMRISTYFSKNMNDAADVTFETEFEKFNLYMLEETNKKGNNVIRISEDGKEIEFKDGNIFTFTKENEDETGKIYLNENIKICENVNNCIFNLESKILLSTSITINEKTENVKYYIKSTSILPAEYQEVEYIESTGTQYIDSGYLANGDSRIKCDAMFVGPFETAKTTLFGSRISYTNSAFMFANSGASNNNDKCWFNYGSSYATSNFLEMDIKHSIDFSNKLYIDGELRINNDKQNFTTPHTLIIFGQVDGTTIKNLSKIRLYNMEIYTDEDMVRKFVPCYLKSDSDRIGLYDMVNDVFYENKGTEVFLKGEDVIYEDNKEEESFIVAEEYIIDNKARISKEYKEVEYIECTGTQYIDTGYAQKNNPKIEAEIMLTSTSDLDIIGNATASAGCFIIDYKNQTIYYRYGTSSSSTISYSESIINKWTKCIWGNNVYHDGTLLKTVADQDFSTNTQTLLIGKGRTYGKVKFKEVKIFNNNVLVRNLIPCSRKSDNEIGMYDLVHNVFYTNSGTDEFIAGPEVK